MYTVDPHGSSAAVATFSTLSGCFLVYFILPTIARVFHPVEPRTVEFDVEKWRAIKDIHAIEVEGIPFAANQFHDAQTDRVGAVGRPRGKTDCELARKYQFSGLYFCESDATRNI